MAFIIMIYRYLQVGPYGAMRRAALTLNRLRAVKIKQNCPVKVKKRMRDENFAQKRPGRRKSPLPRPAKKGTAATNVQNIEKIMKEYSIK